MKYLLKTLIIFTVIFLALKGLLFLFDKGHQITYNVGNFKIEETLTTKDNNYYFNITHENFKINFQIKREFF